MTFGALSPLQCLWLPWHENAAVCSLSVRAPMSIDLSCQVGRENARFTAMPPCEHMDRVYDVKPVSKRTPVLVTYEKGTGRDEARISHTERGSCLDYNPKYTLVEKAVAYKFGSAARPTTVESATMDQRAEKKKQYKEMQDDLLLQKRR